MFDERSRPDFPDVFRRLATAAAEIRTAVTRVRISTLDFDPDSLDRLRSFRVVVAELNALHLDAEARLMIQDERRAHTVRLLTRLLESGILEVRSAPLGGWSPDFTVFRAAESDDVSVLTGFHWFERPYPHRGPALASLHHGSWARGAAVRHQEVWASGHDVGPALWTLLARAGSRGVPQRRAG